VANKPAVRKAIAEGLGINANSSSFIPIHLQFELFPVQLRPARDAAAKVTEAVSAKRVLAAMHSALAPSQTKTTTLRGLPDLEHQIDARAIESTTIVATGPSFEALDELLDDWENLAAESTSWSLHLTRRVTELEADATRLDRPQKQAWAVRLRVCFGSKGRGLFSRNG
jgi:hypothetical protein